MLVQSAGILSLWNWDQMALFSFKLLLPFITKKNDFSNEHVQRVKGGKTEVTTMLLVMSRAESLSGWVLAVSCQQISGMNTW